MLTMAPAPLARKCTKADFTVRKAPSSFTANTARQSARVIWSSACSGRTAALSMRMSRRPKRSNGRRDQPFDGDHIAHVGQYWERLSAGGGDVGGDGLDGLAITPAIDHHGRTRRGKRQGNWHGRCCGPRP
jgi:hypothetical protein